MLLEIIKGFGVKAEIYSGLIFIKDKDSILVTNRYGDKIHYEEQTIGLKEISFERFGDTIVYPLVAPDNSAEKDLTLLDNNGKIESVERKPKKANKKED
jgi:hypothetical protein